MRTYVIRGAIKQHSHSFLCTPHGFIFIENHPVSESSRAYTWACGLWPEVLNSCLAPHSSVVHRSAQTFLNVLLQHHRGPLTELHTSIGIDAIAYADNHVKIVEFNNMCLSFTFYCAMLSGCCK